MKFSSLILGFSGIAALASLPMASAAEAGACSALQASVAKAVAAAPESVLKVVAEQVAASPKCACEVVKSAIAASKADKATVVAIVEAAAAAAPDQLPVVLACAAASAPQAAAALAEKFRAESAGSGKDVVAEETAGKAPVDKAPVTSEGDDYSDDFGFIRPGVGGIYLTVPNGSGTARSSLTQEEIKRYLSSGNYKLVDGELVRVIVTTVVKPGRPILVPIIPVTPNAPK